MLVLSAHPNDPDDDIILFVNGIEIVVRLTEIQSRNKARIAFDAPRDTVRIMRRKALEARDDRNP